MKQDLERNGTSNGSGSLGRLRLPVTLAVLGLALLFLGVGSDGLLGAQERRTMSAARPKAKGRDGTSAKLWLFFSTSQKDLKKEVARLGAVLKTHPEIAFRPCLLVEDFGAIKKPTNSFASTLRELGKIAGREFSMPVWDAEGLHFAQQLGIQRVPAYVLVTGSKGDRSKRQHRPHTAYGRGVNFKELVTCRSHR